MLAHARALLTSSPEGTTDYIDADFRDHQTILDRAAQSLDFSQPVAVMLIALLHLIGDDADPYGTVRALMAAVPPPGLVPVQQWRPRTEAEADARSAMWGGVARKP